MHIVALVLGIFGVVLIFVPVINFIFSPMLSSAAIITGALARLLLKGKDREEDKKIASAGLVLGVVGMGLCVLLYGSCAYLVDRCLEQPCRIDMLSDDGGEAIEKKMAQMEKRIDSETKRLEQKLDERMEKIEHQLPQEIGTGRAEEEETEKVIKDFMEKKRQMKEELKKWEDWLQTMPILEGKKGGAAPEPEAQPEAAKPPPPKPAAGTGTQTGKTTPKPKQPKKPKVIKAEPDAADHELLSPYEYY